MWRRDLINMERKKLLILIGSMCLVLLLASLPFLTACPKAAPPAEAKTLKIGYLLCVTGWYSVFDAVEEGDVKIVAQMINDKGGLTIDGEKYNIELVGEDGKSTLDGVAAAATKLAYDHKVKFVVGPTGFFSTASSPVFEANNIMHVSGYVSNQPGELDATTPLGFTAFNCSVGTSINAILSMQKEFPEVKTVAIVTPDDGAVPYLIPIIEDMLASYGYSVSGEAVPYPNEMEDFSPIAAQLNAIEADAIFQENGAPVHEGNMLKLLRAMGDYRPWVSQGLHQCSDVIAIAGLEASEDTITSGLTPHAAGNPALMDELYDRGETPRTIYMFNPTGLWVLCQMIQAADSLDPEVVAAKWESSNTVETLFGTGCVSGDETYGIRHHAIGHPLPYQVVKGGEVVYGGWNDVGCIP